MGQLTRNGTDGRVYGGDENLIHIIDGRRRAAGEAVARYIDLQMRQNADKGRYTPEQLTNQALCPGCYMPLIFNAAVALAKANGQDLAELGATLSKQFAALAWNPALLADGIEEIEVIDKL